MTEAKGFARELRVCLDDLVMSPLHRRLGRHALNRLGVHIGDDVLGHHFGGLAIGRSRISWQPTERWDVAEREQDRIGVPYLVFLPIPSSAVGVPLLRREPFGEYRSRSDTLQVSAWLRCRSRRRCWWR